MAGPGPHPAQGPVPGARPAARQPRHGLRPVGMLPHAHRRSLLHLRRPAARLPHYDCRSTAPPASPPTGRRSSTRSAAGASATSLGRSRRPRCHPAASGSSAAPGVPARRAARNRRERVWRRLPSRSTRRSFRGRRSGGDERTRGSPTPPLRRPRRRRHATAGLRRARHRRRHLTLPRIRVRWRESTNRGVDHDTSSLCVHRSLRPVRPHPCDHRRRPPRPHPAIASGSAPTAGAPTWRSSAIWSPGQTAPCTPSASPGAPRSRAGCWSVATTPTAR